jgi:hypothetical protein
MLPAVANLALVLAFQGPALQLPWTCGKVEGCTQGHGGGHNGDSQYAWDFVLSEGEEIWSASAGVVTHRRMNSTVGGCNAAYITEGNYITIDHGDGTSIIYAHMESGSSPLQVGDEVEAGDLLGRVGQTGYVCGAHLHMAVQNQCGASHCASVPSSFAGVGVPDAGQSFESANCPVCPKALDGDVTVIDDEDAGCLQRKTKAWWSALNGHSGHHFYTLGTDADDDVTRASWVFGVDVPGDYEVEVFVPEQGASTTHATYRVHHADGVDEVVIDQSTDKGWQPLGVYAFAGAETERIALGDATGENIDTLARKVAFDAVRFTFVPGASTGDTDGTPTPPPDATTGAAAEDSGPAADPDPAASSDTGASNPTDGSDTEGLPPGFGGDDTGAGCQCNANGPSTPRWAWACLPLWLMARSRRVAQRS